MLANSTVFQKIPHALRVQIEQVQEIAGTEVDRPCQERLDKVLCDCLALYQGEWSDYEACQTGYHNLQHAIDVALVSARMAAGYNRVEEKQFTDRQFAALIIAALFHDAGYIKDIGDTVGTGGKYTFTHVDRSVRIATSYLSREKVFSDLNDTVTRIIQTTEFAEPLVMQDIFPDAQIEALASIAATADLIAQMADVNYLERIRLLFHEFQEAYNYHGAEYLEKEHIYQYRSAAEMIEKTVQFYQDFVLPRMELLGRRDKYLIAFFGEGRNPYLENITANLSGKLMGSDVQWRRIGDILQEFGVVSSRQIEDGLAILKNFQKNNRYGRADDTPFRTKFLSWIDGAKTRKNLGDILIETKAVDPGLLRKGLIDQILPPALIDDVTSRELLFLLQVSIMLHNISQDHWVFEQILCMANELLSCEASTILLAHPNSPDMVIAVSTAIKKEFYLGRVLPQDKGLAGWVFLQDRPAVVNDIETDERYDVEIDNRFHFEPRSVLAVPLHANGRPIGVMEFLNKKESSFQQRDVQLMALFANIIALSLNAALRLHR